MIDISQSFLGNFKGCGLDPDVDNGCEVCSSVEASVLVFTRGCSTVGDEGESGWVTVMTGGLR